MKDNYPDVPDRNPQNSIGLLILAGVGAGALTGALFALLASRRLQTPTRDGIEESVDDLKRRAEQILTELSQTSAASSGTPRPR